MKKIMIIFILACLLLSVLSFADEGTSTNVTGTPHPSFIVQKK